MQQPAPKKPTRINWGKGDHRIKMKKAIKDWLEEEGDQYDDSGERIDNWRKFANKVGIPPLTLFKYIHPDAPKRTKLGNRDRKALNQPGGQVYRWCPCVSRPREQRYVKEEGKGRDPRCKS